MDFLFYNWYYQFWHSLRSSHIVYFLIATALRVWSCQMEKKSSHFPFCNIYLKNFDKIKERERELENSFFNPIKELWWLCEFPLMIECCVYWKNLFFTDLKVYMSYDLVLKSAIYAVQWDSHFFFTFKFLKWNFVWNC